MFHHVGAAIKSLPFILTFYEIIYHSSQTRMPTPASQKDKDGKPLLYAKLASKKIKHPFSQRETFKNSEATAHPSSKKRALCRQIDLQNMNC